MLPLADHRQVTSQGSECKRHGVAYVAIKRIGKEDILYCEQCADEDIARDQGKNVADIVNGQEDIQQRQYEKRYRDLGMGRRYERATFDDFKPPCKEAENIKRYCERYAITFQDRLRDGDSLIMCGRPGTGKNHLAAAICKAVVDLGFKAVHTTAIKLVRRVMDTWVKGANETQQQAINLFVYPHLLVIDEVGVQFGSQAEQVILMEVINSRYSDMMPTILISNLPVKDKEGNDCKGKDGLQGFIGEQIVDRFYEGKSGVLEFGWGSYRRQNKQPNKENQ